MSRRSYNQICGLAQALDLIGERWTMLIVRELLLGPKRFGALKEALPGISANLLSTRLQELTEAGLIESVELPAPARGVSAYALTERGAGLRETVESLSLWGMELLEPKQQAAEGWTARGSLFAATRMAAARRSGTLADTAALTVNADVDGDRFVIQLDGDGSGSVRHGEAERPDAELTLGLQDFFATVSGSRPLSPADVGGDDGELAAVTTMLAALREPQPLAAGS